MKKQGFAAAKPCFMYEFVSCVFNYVIYGDFLSAVIK